MNALHQACSLARQWATSVILLRLIPVQPGCLGTDEGWIGASLEDYQDLLEYKAIVEDYGVELVLQPMQYIDIKEAIVQAADLLAAEVVFVAPPHGALSWWHTLQLRNLEQQLSLRQRRLYKNKDYSLENPKC